MRLSVLDQSPIAEGSTGTRALHDTLELAEQFSVLAGLFPERIDLGLGRASARPDDDVRAAARPPAGLARRFPGEYRASEVIVVTITYSHEARMRSYELIADAFGLSSASTASANSSV